MPKKEKSLQSVTVRDKIIHIKSEIHKKFKRYCFENDINLGETAEKALIKLMNESGVN